MQLTSGEFNRLLKAIRDAGGCTDFVAIITYPNTKTQIPSHYSYTYTILRQIKLCCKSSCAISQDLQKKFTFASTQKDGRFLARI